MNDKWISRFPHPSEANADGIVAVGGTPTPDMLQDAYQHGIFPWPMGDHLPLLWFSPDPRFVIHPGCIHIPKSLQKVSRKNLFSIAADRNFQTVIENCARTPRSEQNGTWITDDMLEGYLLLHEEGYAHSVEAYIDDELVGGLYGVSFGAAFFGESMYTSVNDASKIAFMTLLGNALHWGFHFIDCQVHTGHLERFGAMEISRDEFLEWLQKSLAEPTRRGPWELALTPENAMDQIDACIGS